jgi:hypothetical protein
LKAERDHPFSLLVEADAKIVDLLHDNAELQANVAKPNVTPIAGRKPALHGPSVAQDLAADSEFEDIK